jgi:type I restriction enzyme S subunit
VSVFTRPQSSGDFDLRKEWFGSCPAHWRALPLRQSVQVLGGGTPSKDEGAFWGGDLPWASPKDIKAHTIWDTEDHITALGLQSSATQLAPADSVLVVFRSGILRHSLPTAVAGHAMALNQDLKAFVCRRELLPSYLDYVLQGLGQRLLTLWRNQGATVESLDLPIVARTVLPNPPLAEQRVIAAFLDRETARIDALVAAKRRMMEVFEERVCLAFDRAIQQQGFEFPVELGPNWTRWPRPRHWTIMHLSQALVQLTNGFVGPTRDILCDDGIPYVQSLHIKNGRIDFARRPFFVDPIWHNERPRIHLREDDVLIVQTGDIGQVAVVPPAFGAASCHALQIARVKRNLISGRYLAAYLRSPFGRQSLISRATGALHPHLEAGIKDIPVVVPPRSVQDVVVEQIDQAELSAANMMSVLHRQGQLLQERRQALITAAVTGRLDIAEAA